MIVLETPKRSNTRWLQACVLVCAIVVLPLGIASAQDYKAVERRLGEAVSSGELSLEQAGLIMDALRRTAQQDERRRITREDYARAEAGLKKAVAEGKISEEDGRAKLAAMRIMIAEKSEGAARKGVDWEGIKKRIEGAVKSGDMTREEADAKYKEIRERLGRTVRGENTRGDQRADIAAIGARIRAAIAAGKMTEEQGRARMAALRERLGQRVRGKDAKDKDDD